MLRRFNTQLLKTIKSYKLQIQGSKYIIYLTKGECTNLSKTILKFKWNVLLYEHILAQQNYQCLY